MTMFDSIFLNILYVMFPFVLYLFYLAYRKDKDKKEDELAFTIVIFTSLYLVIKFGSALFPDIPILIVNLPLLMAYYRKNNISIIAASIAVIGYYFNYYDNYLLIIILGYVIYYVIYLFTNKKITITWFIITFAVLKITMTMIFTADIYEPASLFDHFLGIIFSGGIYCLITIGLVYILEKAKEGLKMQVLTQESDHDKQIRTTLFQITHEIKNPIAVCKGYLDMFDINNPEHAKRYVPIMKEEIGKTLILLEDFLSMNRIKLNTDILDINLLLEDVLKSYRLYFNEHNIVTNLKITDDEIYVEGDYNKLVQVFTNIIKNSIEAVGDNPIIEVWTEVKDSNLTIYFKDNGSGISKQDMKKIKEPFFTTKIKGTGLGVSLSSGIIDAHGGKLNYESDEGVYTLASVTLPINDML